MVSRYGLEIRAAAATDALGLAALMAALGRPSAVRVLADRIEALRQEPGVLLLAYEWGPPSGVVATSWRRTLQADAPTAQITLLAVSPQERRRGVGRLLLKAASQAARLAGCTEIALAASEDAPELQAFCRATGFLDAGASFVRPLRKKS